MKQLAALAVILGLALVIPAVGQDTSARPDGVSADVRMDARRRAGADQGLMNPSQGCRQMSGT